MAGIIQLVVSIIAGAVSTILLYILRLIDFKLPHFSLESYLGIKKSKYKILAIDPHPDDETMTSGGFLSMMASRADVELKHICLTKGEKGDELISASKEVLASMREKEYVAAVNILGIKNYEILDFPDGGLIEKKDVVELRLKDEIAIFKPDLILTYEKGGLYGHPDHVALTSVIEKIVKESHPEIKILYKTMPQQMIDELTKSVEMNLVQDVEHSYPKYMFPVGRVFWKKYKAAKSHKSQDLGNGKPLLLVTVVLSMEYFTD